MRKIVVEITILEDSVYFDNKDMDEIIWLCSSGANQNMKYEILSDTADPQVMKMQDWWKPNTTSDVYPVPDAEVSRADRQKEAIKRMSVTVHCDPVLEAIARKLLGIERVPEKYQADMIKAAAKAGAEALRAGPQVGRKANVERYRGALQEITKGEGEFNKRYVLGEGYVGFDDNGRGSEKVSLWEDIDGENIVILSTPKALIAWDQPRFRLVLERIDKRKEK